MSDARLAAARAGPFAIGRWVRVIAAIERVHAASNPAQATRAGAESKTGWALASVSSPRRDAPSRPPALPALRTHTLAAYPGAVSRRWSWLMAQTVGLSTIWW